MFLTVGKCEVRDITAALHDRYGRSSETVLVINKDKVWRIERRTGEIVDEKSIKETWPKDIREYFRATNSIFDPVFPLRAAFYAEVV